jgi:hypothetical protein
VLSLSLSLSEVQVISQETLFFSFYADCAMNIKYTNYLNLVVLRNEVKWGMWSIKINFAVS